MSFWDAIALGAVQGATEFLPVSSSGHLVLAQELMGITLPGVVFEVVVHLATLVSILLVYRARVTRLVAGSLRGDRDALRYLGALQDPESLADLAACTVLQDSGSRQALLEIENVEARLRKLIQFLLAEIRQRRKSREHE